MDTPTRLEIYGRDDCRYCAAAKALCERRGLRFDYRDMTRDPELRQELEARRPDFKTVPQVFLGNHAIGGFDDLSRAVAAGVIQQIIGGR